MVRAMIRGSRPSAPRAAGLTGLVMGMLASAVQPTHADDAAPPSDPVPDKSGYTLFNPTPDDEMRKFTPDRPAKGFSVRTVDAGHVEIETDFASYTYSNGQGTITRGIQALDPNFKLGLTDWMDVEVQFNGLQYTRLFDTASGRTTIDGSGFGDVFLRTKMNLFGNDSGFAGLALIPYVKLPSAAPLISNGAVEGGLIAPLALRPADYIITLMTEIDVLKTATGNGRYTNFVNLIGVSHPVPGLDGVNATVELYSSAGTDPATRPVYTFDLGANFKLDKHSIVDIGLNLGLNRNSPKAQVYSGLSFRF
ncbi:transporter [Bradyrhizobium genosp. P]|uniref:transporter n=1 Tax=Bradyrhizobium genosp. P TaxID=83641 RepID=UPI003CF73D3B